METNDALNRGQHPAFPIIEAAMKRGDFDNLPNHGKPLELVELDPSKWSDQQALVNSIRQNANIGSQWEEVQRQIETALERAKREIETAHRLRTAASARRGTSAAAVEAKWQAGLKVFNARSEQVNSKVLTFNLTLPRPLSHLHKPRWRAEDILSQLGIKP